MSRVSVLINNRDNAPFLRQCVGSVLAQTRRADEVIVYDDGSCDGSREVLESFGDSIQVMYRERACGSPMRNQARAIASAFAASTGDYIFLLDADDAFMPDHIESYLPAFEGSPAVVMVQAPLWKIDGDGKVIGLEYDERRHATDYLEQIYATHEVNIYYPTSALAFRRSYLAQRLPLPERDPIDLWPDAQLALVAPHFGKIVTLHQPETYWRRHPRSHTVMKKTSVYEQVRMNRQFYNAFCRQHHLRPVHSWRSPQQMKRWLRHMCPLWLIHCYQRLLSKPPPRDVALERWAQRNVSGSP